MTEQNLLSYLHSLPDNQPGIAMDIGANIGQYTGLLARKFERVFAFEPNPVNYAHLIGNVKDRNITFMPDAIGRYDDIMTKLYLAQSPGMHTINDGPGVVVDMYGRKPDHFIMVPSMTLDRFAELYQNIKMIKCDIESGENFIFEYGRKLLTTNKLTILLEVHMTVDCVKLYNLFTDCGYRIYDDSKKNLVKEFGFDQHFIIMNEG